MLEVRDLSVRYGAFDALRGVSFSLSAGDWLMVVGPNGAGKSTLLSAVSGGAPFSGEVRWFGRELRSVPPRQRARFFGVLSQSHAVGYDFTVREVAGLGLYAFGRGPFASRAQDERSVARALELTGMTAYADHSVTTLSGGELQRAFLAQLFAQDPKVLLLDEPTNHLDIAYQRQVFDLIRAWLDSTGGAVLSVVHDLSLARLYGTRALLLDRGRTAACGGVAEVLRGESLRGVYGVDVAGWMRTLLSQWEE